MSSKFRALVSAPGGKAHWRSVTAVDEAEARAQVQQAGAQVVRVEVAATRPALFASLATAQSGRKRFDALTFCAQLRVLLEAGMSLPDSLQALSGDEGSDASRQVTTQLRARLASGHRLSDAMDHESGFEPLLCAMIRASEQTANITNALSRYIAYCKQRDTLKSAIQTAAIYPAFLLLLGTVVIAFLLMFVVPRFSGLFSSMQGDLPLPAQLIMLWGEAVKQHGLWLGFAIALTGAALAYGLSRKSFRDSLLDRVYRFGPVGKRLRLVYLARVYRTIALLLSGGIPVSDALKISAGVLPEQWERRLAQAHRAIEAGLKPSQALEGAQLLSSVAKQLILAGENSGRLSEMFDESANFVELSVSKDIEQLTRLAEPVLMTGIGVIVGAIVVMMYIPIFELAGGLG